MSVDFDDARVQWEGEIVNLHPSSCRTNDVQVIVRRYPFLNFFVVWKIILERGHGNMWGLRHLRCIKMLISIVVVWRNFHTSVTEGSLCQWLLSLVSISKTVLYSTQISKMLWCSGWVGRERLPLGLVHRLDRTRCHCTVVYTQSYKLRPMTFYVSPGTLWGFIYNPVLVCKANTRFRELSPLGVTPETELVTLDKTMDVSYWTCIHNTICSKLINTIFRDCALLNTHASFSRLLYSLDIYLNRKLLMHVNKFSWATRWCNNDVSICYFL